MENIVCGIMLEGNSNKVFVLDTNVVLYDYRCIYSFEEHNVVIPITLLEEIDKFKRGNEIINYNAREFSRELDALINTDIKLVTLAGKSGTGKTLMALAAALERRNNYKQILLARPIIPLSNRDIGYLPGDIRTKLGPLRATALRQSRGDRKPV